MRLATAAASLFLLTLPGCIAPSLHPLYTEAGPEIVFDRALLGTWTTTPSEGEESAAETWTFAAGDERDYRLAILTEGRVSHLRAVLVKLGEHRFLDLTLGELPEEQQSCLPQYVVLHLMPVHSSARIRLDGDTLSLAFLDSEWVSDQATQGKLGIRGEAIDDAFVLTASPKDLQAFLLSVSGNDDAFPDPGHLTRVE